MSQPQALVHTLIHGSVRPSCCPHHHEAGPCLQETATRSAHSVLSPATERRGNKREELAPGIPDPPAQHICSLSCVWEKEARFPGRGPLREKTKASLHSAHPSPGPGSREAVVIILRHLLGKLQILLLPLTPFLWREGPRASPRGGAALPSCLPGFPLERSTLHSCSPLPTPGPCCRIWEESAWPENSRGRKKQESLARPLSTLDTKA